MIKYLLQLVKLEPVSVLETGDDDNATYTKIGDDHYKQSITAIQLTPGKIEALLALIENIEVMAANALAPPEQLECRGCGVNVNTNADTWTKAGR